MSVPVACGAVLCHNFAKVFILPAKGNIIVDERNDAQRNYYMEMTCMKTNGDSIPQGIKHIHFIGIGGSGMFPLVEILHAQGYYITGSDNNESDILTLVRKLGIPVAMGQRAENIAGADMIVHTAAIMADNPELLAAKASGKPVWERSRLLGVVTSWYGDCVCVSGTHGKTTTSALLTQILLGAGLDPTAVIGGKLPVIGGYGRLGKTDIMVCEACEFVDTFLQLHPDVSVILNVDADHLDYFGTLENVIKSFRRFAQLTSRTLIVNGDDPNAMQAVQGLEREKEVITFGLAEANDYYAANIVQHTGVRCSFDLMHRGRKLTGVELKIPGRHNVYNAVAAAAAAITVGADPLLVAQHAALFGGAGRRFEILGERRGVTIADDYAHHPAELEATLTAAKEMGFGQVWAVFQPFTYSRTAMLLDDFARALSIADRVVMSEIMGSREVNTYNIYTKDLAEKIPGSVWYDGFGEMADYVMQNARPGDLVITLGCGDVYKCARMMLK